MRLAALGEDGAAGSNSSAALSQVPRTAEKPFLIALAPRPHRHVDGQHQRLDPAIGGAADQVLADLAVARRIELDTRCALGATLTSPPLIEWLLPPDMM